MPLFDPGRQFYVLVLYKRNFGSGENFDENRNKIGLMHRVDISIGGKIELKDLEGETECVLHEKIVAPRQIFSVKDGSGNSLGRIKWNAGGGIQSQLWLEGPGGTQLFQARGNLMRRDFTIFNPNGLEVAQVNRLDKWNGTSVKGMFDYKRKFRLQITDDAVGRVDSRLLVGSVIVIGNFFHN